MKDKECQELKNIEYKTMLLHNKKIKKKKEDNIIEVDHFLNSERTNQSKKTWNKLEKTLKKKKIQEYVKSYSKKNKLLKKEQDLLLHFLFNCLRHKKLQRMKDVVYDIETQQIKSIQGLQHNKKTSRFTIRKTEKNNTLKCLAPKTKTRKKRNKKDIKKNK